MRRSLFLLRSWWPGSLRSRSGRLRSRGLFWLAAGLLLGPPSPALAGYVLVDFDLTSSTIQILGGAVTIPPEGSITAGSVRIRANANGLTSVLAGPIVLESLAFDVSISGDVGGGAFLTGALAAGQVGSVPGTLNPALSLAAFPGSLVLDITGTLDCAGVGCGFLGTFPTFLSGPNTYTSLPTFSVANVNLSGLAGLQGTLSFTIAGLTAVMNLTGTEVSRTFFVPEPDTSGLLALGLVALAGGSWLRRQSARSSGT